MIDSSWEQPSGSKYVYLKCIVGLGTAAFVGLSTVLAMGNPRPQAYETFATQQLIQYVSDNVCADAPTVLDLQNECRTQLRSRQSDIQQLIATQTQRQNFLIFSIYQTNLSVSSMLPSYRVQTLGLFHHFYIVKAEEQRGSLLGEWLR